MSHPPADQFGSYYGEPIVKAPPWQADIPAYLFTGGIAGASAALALGATLRGQERLARTATYLSLAAGTFSPILLIRDLGRPERFLNMLRVAKVTSPMSVGTWILAGTGTVMGVATACDIAGILPRVRLAALTAGGVLGLGLATYTAPLLADTALPAWHGVRRELPFVFAGSAAASAGGAAAVLTPPGEAGAARRLAISGALLELVAGQVMERRLGPLVAEPYETGQAGRRRRLARAATAAGALALASGGRWRIGEVAGGTLLLAGSLLERFGVFAAGMASARDPRYTVGPQRQRLAARAVGGGDAAVRAPSVAS